jgi:hypothetical protein
MFEDCTWKAAALENAVSNILNDRVTLRDTVQRE